MELLLPFPADENAMPQHATGDMLVETNTLATMQVLIINYRNRGPCCKYCETPSQVVF